MSAHEILIAVMAVFALLGAADRIFGNRWGLGKEFEEGILAMGSLALAILMMLGTLTATGFTATLSVSAAEEDVGRYAPKGTVLVSKDAAVTLSTCTNVGNGRYALHAKLVKVER